MTIGEMHKLLERCCIEYCIEIQIGRERVRQIGDEPISLAQSKKQAIQELYLVFDEMFDEIVKE